MKRENSRSIKGVAILMMFWHHLYLSERFQDCAVNFWPITAAQAINIANYLKICVSLFAFVSGYGLLLSFRDSADSTGRWIGKRYVKTFRSYWFVLVLAWIVCALLDGRTWQVYGFETSPFFGVWNMGLEFLGLTHFFYLYSSLSILSTWWYMSAALAYILLLPLLYRLFQKVGAVCTLGAVLLLPRVFCLYPGHGNFYSFLPAFCLGAIFALREVPERIDGWFEKRLKTPRRRFWAKALLYGALTAAGYKVFYFLPDEIWWDMKWDILPLPVILLIREVSRHARPLRALWGFLGDRATNLFLVHTFISSIYLHEFTYSWGHFAVIYLVLLAVSLLASYGIELLKKVVGYDRLLERLDRAWAAAKPD